MVVEAARRKEGGGRKERRKEAREGETESEKRKGEKI